MPISREDELVKAGTFAARELLACAHELRGIEDGLPRNTAKATRSHLLAIADRLMDVGMPLSREVDRPEPSRGLIRRLSWAGPIALAGLAGVLGGAGDAALTAILDDDVRERIVEIERRVEEACDHVLSVESGDEERPPLMTFADGRSIAVWHLMSIEFNISNEFGSHGFVGVPVRPSGDGGIWVSNILDFASSRHPDDIDLWFSDDGGSDPYVMSIPLKWVNSSSYTGMAIERRLPPGGKIALTPRSMASNEMFSAAVVVRS